MHRYPCNVTVWSERERDHGAYPDGIHNVIRDFLKDEDGIAAVRTAAFRQPECGLPQEVLDTTDVLIWWDHGCHHRIPDDLVDRIHHRVLRGMGLILLHSAHASKIFARLMGTRPVQLRWRDVGERERVWVVEHNHPITAGLPEYFEIPQTEMYGERFNIPAPDELLFISWYQGGEVFRSGCTFKRGQGKIFYFSPGHETYPIYHIPEVQQVIRNAVFWAAPLCNPSLCDSYAHPPERI